MDKENIAPAPPRRSGRTPLPSAAFMRAIAMKSTTENSGSDEFQSSQENSGTDEPGDEEDKGLVQNQRAPDSSQALFCSGGTLRGWRSKVITKK